MEQKTQQKPKLMASVQLQVNSNVFHYSVLAGEIFSDHKVKQPVFPFLTSEKNTQNELTGRAVRKRKYSC